MSSKKFVNFKSSEDTFVIPILEEYMHKGIYFIRTKKILVTTKLKLYLFTIFV